MDFSTWKSNLVILFFNFYFYSIHTHTHRLGHWYDSIEAKQKQKRKKNAPKNFPSSFDRIFIHLMPLLLWPSSCWLLRSGAFVHTFQTIKFVIIIIKHTHTHRETDFIRFPKNFISILIECIYALCTYVQVHCRCNFYINCNSCVLCSIDSTAKDGNSVKWNYCEDKTLTVTLKMYDDFLSPIW